MGGEHKDEEEEEELLINNISVLEDMESSLAHGPLNETLKQKFKSQKEDLGKVRKRIVHLEGLLTANLDSLAAQ